MRSQDACGITLIGAHKSRRACQKHVTEAVGMAGATARVAGAEGRPWPCRFGKDDSTIRVVGSVVGIDENEPFRSCFAVILRFGGYIFSTPAVRYEGGIHT